MKIKTSKYLREIREAEERGYRRGREEAFRESSNDHLRGETFEMINKLEETLREVKREVFTQRIKGKAPAKHADEPVNVGDEIANKCF